MTRTTAALGLGLALLIPPAARAADPDPAALFPADTLAYAEVGKPGELADVLADWVKRTPFADPLKRTHDALDQKRDHAADRAARVVGAAAALVSPEMFAELKRFRGAAVGLTGFAKDHRPEVAAAVLLGDSNLAGLAVRAFLAGGENVRRVATVDGVGVFQHRSPVGPATDPNGQPFRPDDDANPLKGHAPAAGTGEPTYAYTPGLFVVGTSPDAVGGVLRRFAGKEKTGSLADAESFRKVAADRGPGVFLYADPPRLLARIDAAKKAGGDAVPPEFAAFLRFVVNPKAVPVVRGNVIFKPDAVGLVLAATLDPAADSPLFGVLGGGPVSVENLRFAAKDAGWAVTVALPAKADRAASVIRLLDGVAKANGVAGRLPGEALTGASERDLFAGITAVTLFAAAKQELPAGGVPGPMVVLHAESEAVAGKWVDAAAKLAHLANPGGAAPTPASETIGGVKVVSVADGGFPWKAAVHVARAGSAVVVGLDRKLVAAAVAGKDGPNPPAFDGPAAGFGFVRPTAYPAAFAGLGAAVVDGLTPGAGRPGDGNFVPPGRFPQGEPLDPEEAKKRATAATAAVRKAADGFPPVAVRVARTPSAVRVEVWQRGLDTGFGPLVTAVVGWIEHELGKPPAGGPGVPGVPVEPGFEKGG